MVVIKDHVIDQKTADAACKSLDDDVDRKRREGALEAGKSSFVGLEWTREATIAVTEFETAFNENVRT